ncbi:hypothetical protein C0J52_06576 [Blattella germanica]|nr:hypothetical protein C0J52_06576 [Blattella germanica]
MTSTITHCSFRGVICKTESECIIYICLAVVGFVGYLYVLSSIIASRASHNVDLTSYQEKMHSLVAFMSNNKIHSDLRSDVIRYFEQKWARNEGKDVLVMLKVFHFTLREDLLLSVFGKTLKQCAVLSTAGTSFFRVLLEKMKFRFYMKHGIVINTNDIQDEMYILHKGRIDVIGPDGTRILTLQKGATWELSVLIAGAFVTYILTLYQVALVEFHISIIVVYYILDATYLFKIYLKFHLSYEDEYGDTINDLGKIANRYMKDYFGLYLDIFTLIPFEVFAFAAGTFRTPKFLIAYGFLRFNRLPRIVSSRNFKVGLFPNQLRVATDRIHANDADLRVPFCREWILTEVGDLNDRVLCAGRTRLADCERLHHRRDVFGT